MTQKVEIFFSGFNGTAKINFNGIPFTMFPQQSSLRTIQPLPRVFNVEVGSYPITVSLVVRANKGSIATVVIKNNGHIIGTKSQVRVSNPTTELFRRTDNISNPILIEALEEIQTAPPPPPPEPEQEIFNICANVFSLRGSTALGAPPQEKVLVSSGCSFSQQQLEIIRASGDIVEFVSSNEVIPVGEVPTTPQSPFTKDRKGNKIFKIELVESLVIKDRFSHG